MMAVEASNDDGAGCPNALQSTKLFSRFESSGVSPFARSRASTVQNGVVPQVVGPDRLPLSPDKESSRPSGDVFEKTGSTDDGDRASPEELERSFTRSQSLPERFDELPIELISLTDRFVESLTAKVYTAPPSIDRLSDLFQEFYVRAASHISTHISTLASRLHRETSPNPTRPSRSSSKSASALASKTSRDAPEPSEASVHDQQMLTASEVAERRKARRLLEYKRVALEEAVERRACETVYGKLWRHKSTLDEVRDEKLRSKTAALALVGIGLKDLGIEVGDNAEKKEEDVRDWLAGARDDLCKMNNEQYPLGILQHLTAAHKAIVETLSEIHPSSSSADEILPTLIYALITSPPEGINIISNLSFIQRFRAINKVDGEAAYCMTNLEAAISFLENVDLSSLRADETPEGPLKSTSRPSTPTVERLEPWPAAPNLPQPVPSPSLASATVRSDSASSNSSLKAPTFAPPSKTTPPVSPLHQRRLSNLLQPSAKAIGAANDAVRTTADQGFKNISNTLDNSFKFLFGRLKEEQMSRANNDAGRNVVMPKTLDDARRLVNQPSILDDGSNMSEASSIAETAEPLPDTTNAKPEDKVLGLIGGRKQQPRERSVDSVRSSGSGRKVAFAARSPLLKEESVSPVSAGPSSSLSVAPAPTSTPPNAALESMRNLGNTLNPLSHFGSLNPLRGFGRNAPETPPILAATTEKSKQLGTADMKPLPIPMAKANGESVKIDPPLQRFLELDNAGDLKMSEVSELLQDYKRLASALKSFGAL